MCGAGYQPTGAACVKERNKENLDKLRLQEKFIDDLIACTVKQKHANVFLNISTNNDVTGREDNGGGDGGKFEYPNTKTLQEESSFTFYSIEVDSIEEIQVLKQQLKRNRTGIPGKGNLLFTSFSPHTDTKLEGITLNKGFPGSKMCQRPIELKNNSMMVVTPDCALKTTRTRTNTAQMDAAKANGTQVIFPKGSYLVHFEMSVQTNELTYKIYTCEQFFLHSACLRVEIPLQLAGKDYKYLPQNGTILLAKKNTKEFRTYNASDFIPTENGISVCLDTYITNKITTLKWKPKWVDQAEEAQSYLTMVGCVISVICYIFTIVVYTKAKELHTISGRNIIGICASLLIADILILLTSAVEDNDAGNRTKLCSVIAYLLHYVLLTAHVWAALISFEVMRTLRHGTSHRRSTLDRRTFTWYCSVAYISPLVALTAVWIVNATGVTDMGYGDNNVCWIGILKYRVMFYLVPVVCIFVFNTIVVVSVLIYLHLHKQRSERLLLNKIALSSGATGSPQTTVLKTALKLIFLMGLLEVIGFIQLPCDQETWKAAVHVTVQFVYVCLRAFRGMFVWILYVYLNERAWKYKTCRQSGSYSPKGSPVTTLTRRSNVNMSNSVKSSFKITQTLNDTFTGKL